MLKKFTSALCLSTILCLSACGEQKSNSVNNVPVGLVSESEQTDKNKIENTSSNQKYNKKEPAPWSGQVVNINTASSSELITALKGTGVGEAKVKKIIEYREQNGGFKSVEELNEVKGIGDKTMDKLRERVTVSSEHTVSNKPSKIEEK